MIPTKIQHCKRSEKPQKCTSSLMRKVTVLRTSSPVEVFYRQDIPCPNGTCDAVSYRTDIYMLFNQQRLDRMTLNQLSDWLDNQVPTNSFNELRSKMSDSQLHQFIKSRYIQSPSELMAWSEYVNSEFGAEYQDAVLKAQKDADDKSKQLQQAQSTTPATPAAPAASAE